MLGFFSSLKWYACINASIVEINTAPTGNVCKRFHSSSSNYSRVFKARSLFLEFAMLLSYWWNTRQSALHLTGFYQFMQRTLVISNVNNDPLFKLPITNCVYRRHTSVISEKRYAPLHRSRISEFEISINSGGRNPQNQSSLDNKHEDVQLPDLPVCHWRPARIRDLTGWDDLLHPEVSFLIIFFVTFTNMRSFLGF